MLFNTTLVVEKYKYNVNYPKLHIIAFILEEDIPPPPHQGEKRHHGEPAACHVVAEPFCPESSSPGFPTEDGVRV